MISLTQEDPWIPAVSTGKRTNLIRNAQNVTIITSTEVIENKDNFYKTLLQNKENSDIETEEKQSNIIDRDNSNIETEEKQSNIIDKDNSDLETEEKQQKDNKRKLIENNSEWGDGENIPLIKGTVDNTPQREHRNKRKKTNESDSGWEEVNNILLVKNTEDNTPQRDPKEKQKKVKNTVTKRKKNIKETLDKFKRINFPVKGKDRRKLWSKIRTSSTTLPETRQRQKQYHPEDIDTLSKLSLRLQLNGINIESLLEEGQDIEQEINMNCTLNDETHHDIRTHISRHKGIEDEKEIIRMMNSPIIKEQVENLKNKEWEEFNINNVESELPIATKNLHNLTQKTQQDQDEAPISDVPQVLYGKLKGVRAKILVDSGAKVTVISKDFATSNAVNTKTLKIPAKLSMANGVVEPVFQKTHDVSLVVDTFRHKVTAFVAPIKNYDIILGRDNLLKLNAVIDVTGSVSLFDKRTDKRITLEFGKDHIKDEPLEENCITKEELNRELEKDPDLLVYELSIKQLEETNSATTVKETPEQKLDTDIEKEFKEEFKTIMRDELPDKLPPDRGLNHYIDLQGRIPKSAPRGFRLSEAEYEFMEKHVKGLLDKGLIQPCLGPMRAQY